MSALPPLTLRGLDGSNPLGFLAALGLLRVLDDHAGLSAPRPKLAWRHEGGWVAELHGAPDFGELSGLLLQDARDSLARAELALFYDQNGHPTVADPKAVCDLKPLPSTLRIFHDGVAATLVRTGPQDRRSRRTGDLASAFGSELATDNNGRVKPTALHFTAGQQSFLAMARALAGGVSEKDFDEALNGPWRSQSELPSLSWNASAARSYALRATNPAHEKRGSVPGAEWLAFVGLAALPSASRGRQLATCCVQGRWKDSTFTWPLWSVPASARSICTVLSSADLMQTPAAAREAMGVMAVFQSQILRSDQGGYGSFSPAALH